MNVAVYYQPPFRDFGKSRKFCKSFINSDDNVLYLSDEARDKEQISRELKTSNFYQVSVGQRTQADVERLLSSVDGLVLFSERESYRSSLVYLLAERLDKPVLVVNPDSVRRNARKDISLV
jgi:hypothetical protein